MKHIVIALVFAGLLIPGSQVEWNETDTPAPLPITFEEATEDSPISTLGFAAHNDLSPTRAAIDMRRIPGCYGQTNNIHVSESSFISVHAKTVCGAYPKRTSTNLTRERWHGWQWLANGTSQGGKEAITKWYCKGIGTYTYRATTFHRAIVGSDVATAYSWVTSRETC